MFFSRDDILNLEVIRLRAYFQYYHKIDDLYKDLMKLLKHTISARCKNVLAKYYVSEILYKIQSLFKDKERIQKFKALYKKDFEYKFELNTLLKVEGRWTKKPGPQRKYINIDDYIPVIEDEEVKQRMKTSKTSLCNGGCCDEYEKLGPIDANEDHWKSL